MTTENQELSDVLTSNYMLASVMVRTWGATKKDNEATEEVLTNKGAEQGSAIVTKRLFGRKYEKLEDTSARYNYIRNWYYANSVAWAASGTSDRRGARLISAHDAMKFFAEFAKLKGQAEVSREEFLADYDRAVQEAKGKLGSMWDANAYPDVSEVRRKFDASMSVNPLPSGADFSRVSIPAPLAEGLRKRYERQATAQVECAMNDLQERLLKELERMSGQMTKVAAGEKTRLFKSLTSNMRTLTGLARNLIPLNPSLEAVADHIDNELLSVDVESVKDNAALARKLASQAAVAATMLRGEQPAVVTDDIEALLAAADATPEDGDTDDMGWPKDLTIAQAAAHSLGLKDEEEDGGMSFDEDDIFKLDL